MTRQPYVWEVQIRREILEDELAQLREIPYAIWRDAIGAVRSKAVTGRDGRAYTVTVSAVSSGDDRIRVEVCVEGSRLRRDRVSAGFVVAADGAVLE
ncbi:MAG TPA: hypothetical protein VNK92_02935 [Vicinamibacterales bacterium]|nr:hypothetical protein [Vicinamibacterales bacterium]